VSEDRQMCGDSSEKSELSGLISNKILGRKGDIIFDQETIEHGLSGLFFCDVF
jgi:hypothetical protein